MLPLTRILGLAPACALSPSPQSASPLVPKAPPKTTLGRPFSLTKVRRNECHLLRRAISRRACQARLLCEEKTIDITAENESKVMNYNF